MRGAAGKGEEAEAAGGGARLPWAGGAACSRGGCLREGGTTTGPLCLQRCAVMVPFFCRRGYDCVEFCTFFCREEVPLAVQCGTDEAHVRGGWLGGRAVSPLLLLP